MTWKSADGKSDRRFDERNADFRKRDVGVGITIMKLTPNDGFETMMEIGGG